MIVMVAAVIIGCTGGWAMGGSFARLASFRSRAWPLLLIAVGVEASLGATPAPLRPVLAVAACVTAAAWCAINAAQARRAAIGHVLIGLGISLNVVVMALNQGMPVSASALARAGLGRTMDVARGHLYKHTAMTGHTRFRALGDIVPFRLVRTVLSPGDLLMLAGIVAVTWAATQPSPARRFRLANLASRNPG